MPELEVGKYYTVRTVDSETGEIVQEEQFRHSVRHCERNITVFYKKDEDDPRTFLNVRVSAFPQLAEKLSCPLLGHAVMLASFMKYDGYLYQYENSRYPLEKNQLGEVLGVSRSTLSRTLNALEKAEVLKPKRVTVYGKECNTYQMNAAFFYRGKYSRRGKAGTTSKVFTETVRQLYKESGAAQTGFFCKLLPYLDKTMPLICSNPNRDPEHEQAVTLGVNEIAVATGTAAGKVSEYLSRMRYGNRYAFAKLSAGAGAGRKVLFILSPELASRTRGLPTDEFMKYFDVLEAA
ncbi:MAG TPA: helix-turn-helix domain-containing protein [Candidatus Enterococcus stercoravium]|nr:helix-turn-helix domain-containing protein [Candidatus Enterococcus stercoravium]